MVNIEPVRVEVEREEDGRSLALVPALPGVMAYGDTDDEAVRRAKAIALQVLADMIESGEEVRAPLRVRFQLNRTTYGAVAPGGRNSGSTW